jgi:competence protein ComFC
MNLPTLCDAALNLVFPAVCQLCHEELATAAEGYVGAECWRGVHFITAPFCERCGIPYEGEITHPFQCSNCAELELAFSFARSAVLANGPVLDVIHRYKYNGARWFEPFLADLLVRQAAPILEGAGWAVIVPVPLHPRRQRERQFNQAEEMARALGRAANLPVNARLVRRVKLTETQTRLTRAERAVNVEEAFAVFPGRKLNGEKIILVDDVLTTGATTSACAGALRAAGAGQVCVWTVARGVITALDS